MFSYGFLNCSREHKDFVKDVFSTDIDTVAEKQGIEKALVTMLSDDLNQKYVDCARMDPAAFKELNTSEHWSQWGKFFFTCIYCHYISLRSWPRNDDGDAFTEPLYTLKLKLKFYPNV